MPFNMSVPHQSKSMPSVTASDERNKVVANKSVCSLHSENSSNAAATVYGRKLSKKSSNGSTRKATIISSNKSAIQQRIVSARRLKKKTLQNELTEALQTITELSKENRTLHLLHKRQDSALEKFEAASAELPKLIANHTKELQLWQSKYREMKGQCQHIQQTLKTKEAMLLSLNDKQKYYRQLNNDKNLAAGAEKLAEKSRQLEATMAEKEEMFKEVAKQLESIGEDFKRRILWEQEKTKEVLLAFEKTRFELSGYQKLQDYDVVEKMKSKFWGKSKKGGSEMSSDKASESELEPSIDSSREEVVDYNEEAVLETLEVKSIKPMSKKNTTKKSVKFIEPASASASSKSSLSSIATKQAVVKPKITRPTSVVANNAPSQAAVSKSTLKPIPKSVKKQPIPKQAVQAPLKAATSISSPTSAEPDFEMFNKYTDYVKNTNNEDIFADKLREEDFEQDGGVSGEEDEPGKVSIPLPHTMSKHMTKEFYVIRKQLSNEYKERETLLNSFYRQKETTKLMSEDTAKQYGQIARDPINTDIFTHPKIKVALEALGDD